MSGAICLECLDLYLGVMSYEYLGVMSLSISSYQVFINIFVLGLYQHLGIMSWDAELKGRGRISMYM